MDIILFGEITNNFQFHVVLRCRALDTQQNSIRAHRDEANSNGILFSVWLLTGRKSVLDHAFVVAKLVGSGFYGIHMLQSILVAFSHINTVEYQSNYQTHYKPELFRLLIRYQSNAMSLSIHFIRCLIGVNRIELTVKQTGHGRSDIIHGTMSMKIESKPYFID